MLVLISFVAYKYLAYFLSLLALSIPGHFLSKSLKQIEVNMEHIIFFMALCSYENLNILGLILKYDWVSFLPYHNLFGIKGFVFVVVVFIK
jgi:hypothetical protein